MREKLFRRITLIIHAFKFPPAKIPLNDFPEFLRLKEIAIHSVQHGIILITENRTDSAMPGNLLQYAFRHIRRTQFRRVDITRVPDYNRIDAADVKPACGCLLTRRVRNVLRSVKALELIVWIEFARLRYRRQRLLRIVRKLRMPLPVLFPRPFGKIFNRHFRLVFCVCRLFALNAVIFADCALHKGRTHPLHVPRIAYFLQFMQLLQLRFRRRFLRAQSLNRAVDRCNQSIVHAVYIADCRKAECGHSRSAECAEKCLFRNAANQKIGNFCPLIDLLVIYPRQIVRNVFRQSLQTLRSAFNERRSNYPLERIKHTFRQLFFQRRGRSFQNSSVNQRVDGVDDIRRR